MKTLRHILLIARRDLVLIVWRREGLAWIFVMPIVFFYFTGTMTAGIGTVAGSENDPDSLALKAPDQAGFLVDELVMRLEQQNFRVDRPGTDAGFNEYARRLTVSPSPDAASKPDGSLTQWALLGNTIRLGFATDLEGPDASFDRLRIARAVYTVYADAVAVESSGGTIDRDAFADLAAMPRSLDLDIRPAGRREVPPAGFAQAVPGTMVMFTMLIALTAGAIHLVLERNQGLLRRLASTPVSRQSIIWGKLTGRVVVAVIQIAFAMVAGVVLFQVDWGPSLPMVAAVLVGWAVFNAALAIVFGNLARTEAQATGIGVMTSLVLAALGGAWWPIEIAPEWMQHLALLLPTGWAMDAMHKLVNFAYGPVSALPDLIAILGASLVVTWVGVRTFRYG